MTGREWALVAAALLGGFALLAALGWLIRRRRFARVERARSAFASRRADLADAFLRAMAASGSPRGLRWVSAELSGEFELAREKRSGRLVALAAAVVGFEAVEGGDMEGLPAVGLPRQVTAVFVFDGGRWEPTGRVVMNLTPAETLRRFAAEFAPLG